MLHFASNSARVFAPGTFTPETHGSCGRSRRPGACGFDHRTAARDTARAARRRAAAFLVPATRGHARIAADAGHVARRWNRSHGDHRRFVARFGALRRLSAGGSHDSLGTSRSRIPRPIDGDRGIRAGPGRIMAMQGRVVEAQLALVDVGVDEGGALDQCLGMERRWFDACERGEVDTTRFWPLPRRWSPGSPSSGRRPPCSSPRPRARGCWKATGQMRSTTSTDSAYRPNSSPCATFVRAWRAGRCWALALLDRHSEGAALAEENLRLAPVRIAGHHRCRSCGQWPLPTRPADRTARGSHRHDCRHPAELLRCNLLIDLGFARHRAGDEAAARVALRDSADQATRLGVTRLAGVAGRGLLARCPASSSADSGLKSLTPAEQRVVRLAAEGHTNASIAAQLFINMKTVESHLAGLQEAQDHRSRRAEGSPAKRPGRPVRGPEGGLASCLRTNHRWPSQPPCPVISALLLQPSSGSPRWPQDALRRTTPRQSVLLPRVGSFVDRSFGSTAPPLPRSPADAGHQLAMATRRWSGRRDRPRHRRQPEEDVRHRSVRH